MIQVRNILISGLFIISTLSCEPSKKNNSNEVAEKKNEENFDTRAEEKEAEFVADAIAASYAEIKLAELASTKSSNKKVQEIAQLLVKDHTDAITELHYIYYTGWNFPHWRPFIEFSIHNGFPQLWSLDTVAKAISIVYIVEQFTLFLLAHKFNLKVSTKSIKWIETKKRQVTKCKTKRKDYTNRGNYSQTTRGTADRRTQYKDKKERTKRIS